MPLLVGVYIWQCDSLQACQFHRYPWNWITTQIRNNKFLEKFRKDNYNPHIQCVSIWNSANPGTCSCQSLMNAMISLINLLDGFISKLANAYSAELTSSSMSGTPRCTRIPRFILAGSSAQLEIPMKATFFHSSGFSPSIHPSSSNGCNVYKCVTVSILEYNY